MDQNGRQLPTVLVPYAGPDSSGSTMDIFLYLRPETNGVQVESTLLRVIRKNPIYNENLKLVFMANYPGEYIKKRHLIEHHYSFKIKLASDGKKAFTPGMTSSFEKFFNTDFNNAAITGPFEAMEILGIDEDELFGLWVAPEDFMNLYGNTIKRYRNLFIINYDIPALLHRNTSSTDIAVMLFRIYFSWHEFTGMLSEMEECLRSGGIINERNPAPRVFHHTKSPFEQIRDSLEYLYSAGKRKLSNISFFSYLKEAGYQGSYILSLADNPVVRIKSGTEEGEKENTVFEFTKGMSYSEAASFIKAIAWSS